MKLRIKWADGTKLPEQVQVDGTDSFATLRSRVTELPGVQYAAGELLLSLNKKSALSVDDSALLGSTELRSGDMLWILNARTPAALVQHPTPLVEASSSSGKQETVPPLVPSGLLPSSSDEQATNVAMQVDSRHVSESNGVAQGPSADRYLAAEPADAVSRNEEDGCLPTVSYASLVPDHVLRLWKSDGVPLTPAAQLLVVVHAALMESGLELNGKLDLEPLSKGGLCTLTYGLGSATSPAVTCVMKALQLGDYLMVNVAACGSGPTSTRCLRLSLSDQLIDQAAPAVAHNADGIAAGCRSFRDLPTLWRCIKDTLALPTLFSICWRSGLDPPFGLLMLPTEILDKILVQLGHGDLAALCCANRQLRHYASLDLFWRAAFMQEFKEVGADSASLAERVGWKATFRRKWLERRDQRRRMEQQRRAPAVNPYVHNPWMPQPPRIPVTGGDYDRFPQPFFGTGPGMFGGMQPFLGMASSHRQAPRRDMFRLQ